MNLMLDISKKSILCVANNFCVPPTKKIRVKQLLFVLLFLLDLRKTLNCTINCMHLVNNHKQKRVSESDEKKDLIQLIPISQILNLSKTENKSDQFFSTFNQLTIIMNK